MNRPEKLIYFEVVQDAEDGYAYGGFEHLREAVPRLLKEDSAHIEMSTNINEVVDLNSPCNTCKYGNNKTVLRCRECESPYWKNHEPKDIIEENKEEYNCIKVKIKDKDGRVMGDALYDKSRMLLFTRMMTVDYVKHIGFEIEESEEDKDE